MIDTNQSSKTNLYVAWYPKFVFYKNFSAYTLFGETSGCRNQDPKEIPLKKQFISKKNIS